MPEERALFDPRRRAVRFLAMRFAAKEAISKALGTGFRHGVWIRDFGFKANAWGRPEVIFSPRGRAVADRLGAGHRLLIGQRRRCGLGGGHGATVPGWDSHVNHLVMRHLTADDSS